MGEKPICSSVQCSKVAQIIVKYRDPYEEVKYCLSCGNEKTTRSKKVRGIAPV